MGDYHFYNDYLIISSFSIVLVSFPLSLFVLWKDPKSPIHRYFSLFGISVTGWALSLGCMLLPYTAEMALTSSRVSNLFGLFIYIFFYHYVHSLLNLPYRKLLKLGYVLTILATILSILFPHLWIDRVSLNFMGVTYYTHGGWLYLLHPALGFLFPGFAQIKLLQRYRESEGEWKKKCLFMLLATGTGFLGGFTSYFMVFDLPIFPWGVPLVALYPPLLSYAIIRYRLINIRTVIHKTAMWFVLSSFIAIPVGLFFFLDYTWITKLSPFRLSLFIVVLVLGLIPYIRFVQPKIDHLFQRRKYNMQQILQGLIHELAALKNLNNLIDRIASTIQEALYVSKITLVLWNDKVHSFIVLRDNPADDEETISSDDPFLAWIREQDRVIELEEIEITDQFTK